MAGADGHSRAQLRSLIEVERRQLRAELQAGEIEQRRIDVRIGEIRARLAELDKAEHLLEEP